MQDAAEPVPVLLPPGGVEAQGEFHGVALVGGGELAQDHDRRVAGQQLSDGEYGERHHQQHEQDGAEPTQ